MSIKTKFFSEFTIDGVDYEVIVDAANNITLHQPIPMRDEFGSKMSSTVTTNENRGALKVIRKTVECITDYIFSHRPSITNLNAGGDAKKFDLYVRIAEKFRERLASVGYVVLVDEKQICIVRERSS